MFKTLHFCETSVIISMALFFLTVCIFAFAVIRALFMPKKQQEHLAFLPLDDEVPPAGKSDE